jgi:hypothetical protein
MQKFYNRLCQKKLSPAAALLDGQMYLRSEPAYAASCTPKFLSLDRPNGTIEVALVCSTRCYSMGVDRVGFPAICKISGNTSSAIPATISVVTSVFAKNIPSDPRDINIA